MVKCQLYVTTATDGVKEVSIYCAQECFLDIQDGMMKGKIQTKKE